MFVEIVVVNCQKCNDFSHGVIRRPVFAKIDCFLEKLQRGGGNVRSKNLYCRFSYMLGLAFDQNQVCKENVHDYLFPNKCVIYFPEKEAGGGGGGGA